MDDNVEIDKTPAITDIQGISADEVNCLIHAYLMDSGFTHTAYTIRMEAQLDSSLNFQKHIPRGELVDLLSKAILYMEVETHWDGTQLKLDCENHFSLLDPHKCKTKPTRPIQQPAANAVSLTADNSVPREDEMQVTPMDDIALRQVEDEDHGKRKADEPLETNGRVDKRARFEMEPSEAGPEAGPSGIARESEQGNPDGASVEPSVELPARRRRRRPLGPGMTDPNAIQILKGHDCEVFVCAWNPVKIGLLATGSKDAVVNLWNIPGPPEDGSDWAPPCTERPMKISHWSKPKAADLTSLDWNPEGTLLAIGSYDAILRVCDTEGNLYMSDDIHEGPIFATNFSRDGRWLLSASLDGTVCVWDVHQKKLLTQYRNHLDCCLDVDWITDTMFASCGGDKLIHIFQLGDHKPIKTFSGHINEVNQVKCNPKRTRIASCSDDRTARVWNLDNVVSPRSPTVPMLPTQEERVVILKGHKQSVSSVQWCPQSVDGQNELIATSGFDGSARLWDSVTGDCLKVFSDHRRPVYALSFSPEGKWLATGSGDGWLHIYDVKTATKTWSWCAGVERPGIYEIDWQEHGEINRIALALEAQNVAVVDITRIVAPEDAESE
ncbi:WD40 repeat-like protein [Neolentinus lepideus HHB14362 ss-1]|uniref:WD40 repeat-like protein n=1 Tax=Neolentinus lepideus HHB14362 ss-1 TaxID=1314782 RepID=A0A165WAR3_9AGAM|nr:WD40 repeat-like protein [Neolentinus lepideus HHB14362 ss-1]